jgi:hypothetical protein
MYMGRTRRITLINGKIVKSVFVKSIVGCTKKLVRSGQNIKNISI